MKTQDQPRFAFRLRSAEETGEPIGSALSAALAGAAEVPLLIYTPRSVTSRARHGPTVLAVTDSGWLAVEEVDDCHTRIVRSDFAHVICVQMTSILLCGVLRIDFVADGTFHSLALEYNAVREELYWAALQRLLHGISNTLLARPVDRSAERSLLELLPLKFLNSTWQHAPPDEHLLAVVHWPAVTVRYHRWFQRELAPEAMFALSDRELIFISEEQCSWSLRIGRESKYGDVATYLPLVRLRDFRSLDDAGPVGAIELVLGFDTILHPLTVTFPSEHRPAIASFLERAFAARPSHPAPPTRPNG